MQQLCSHVLNLHFLFGFLINRSSKTLWHVFALEMYQKKLSMCHLTGKKTTTFEPLTALEWGYGSKREVDVPRGGFKRLSAGIRGNYIRLVLSSGCEGGGGSEAEQTPRQWLDRSVAQLEERLSSQHLQNKTRLIVKLTWLSLR